MKKTILTGLASCGLALLLAGPIAAQSANQQRINDTKQAVSDYVFLRQTISEEKNEWRVYKEVADRRIEFFKAEIEQLDKDIAELESKRTSASAEINARKEEIAELRAANNVVLNAVPELESRVQAIAAYLPTPLKQRVGPLLSQLGSAKQAAPRVAIVIGILNEIDKFNSEWSLGGDVIENRPVDVLYMGLAIGFYASGDGEVGGTLTPAKGDWQRQQNNDLGPTVARLLAFYNGEIKPAELSPLPLQVTDISAGN